jgi:hypothetical protein
MASFAVSLLLALFCGWKLLGGIRRSRQRIMSKSLLQDIVFAESFCNLPKVLEIQRSVN